MRFGNTIRLLMENFKHAYKLLIYRLVMTLIVCALCSAFVLPELIEIAQTPVAKALAENFKNIFKAFFSPELQTPAHYVENIFGEGGLLKDMGELLLSMRLELVLVCIGCVLVYIAKRFVDTVVYFTVGSILNDKMATYAETSFGTALIANLGKASVYALVYVPIVFVFDVAMMTVCFLLLRFLPVLTALFFAVTVIAFGQALKLSITGPWMPAMTSDGKTLKGALSYLEKGEQRQFGKTYSLYIILVYFVIIGNVVAGLCTFGSALIVTVPVSYLVFICAQHVNYYTMKGKKYFITYERIATNPDHGDTEHFFDYIEEVEKEQLELSSTEEVPVDNENNNIQ